MRKVKILATGEVRTVTNNVAFDLVDSGKGELVHDAIRVAPEYKNRQMGVMQKNKPSGQAPYNVK